MPRSATMVRYRGNRVVERCLCARCTQLAAAGGRAWPAPRQQVHVDPVSVSLSGTGKRADWLWD